MDVLHITHQFAPETRGGVESYVLDVAGEQRRRGLAVAVLAGSHEGWPRIGIEELSVSGLPLYRLHRDDHYFDLYSKAWNPGAEAALEAFLERHAPRLVHVHQWIRMSPNLVELARRRGLPVVVTLHDYYSSCPRAFRLRRDGAACDRELSVASCQDCVPRYGHESAAEIAQGIELFRDQMRAELGMADAVLVGVDSIADVVARTTGLARQRFTLLPLGYRPRFPGAPALPAPGADGPLRFAFWGGVGRHKGVAVLVEAFRRLSADPGGRAIELHVLGGFSTPEFEAQLRSAAAGLALTFHGPFATEDLRTVAPHVGVFPSTCLETHGIVLDECFELGLPCVVSDLGALAERAGPAALVVRAGDPEALAQALRRLRIEPDLWSRLQAHIPAPPPGLEGHVDRLHSVYDAARTAAARGGAGDPLALPIDRERRIALLQLQRESALATIEPGERHE